ncbi:hypothetical protein PENFLA_c019G06276 [Penicillium flavigenum]|uniref:Altered inheritance of mitochondria protein 9, mitochondrial n=1 Tax=Penicillium flavigenum TaxID=254877 RepID=A0A1V6SZI5_9EURO|nr:hypothetical protein PENFLA_c019G06276 [Penicillium flavigenum]
MDDGKEVIAKLRNPNAGPQYFTTASEVATMDYLRVRNVLNIPAPTVYAWSPSTEEIGVEVIELGDKKNTVGVEFAAGPTTNRAFFDDGRDAVDIHRGPCASILDYVSARANRELACLQTFSEFPRPQGLFYGPDQYQPTAQRKQEALRNVLKVAMFLSPKDKEISKPVLWHPDLHGDNIFVNPDQPAQILSIIDWQALPDNFDDLSPKEQLEAKKLRAAQSLYKLSDIQMMQKCLRLQLL